MKFADWIKILYTYGPFAILVFLVFVTERKSRTAMKEASEKQERTFRIVYVLNWVAIFGLVVYCVLAWTQINTRRPEIHGRVESLLNAETLGTSFADLYLHKYPKGGGYSDYDFLLVSKGKKWTDGMIVKFTIQAPRLNSKEEDLWEYDLPIQSDFYENGVLLRRDQDKLFLHHNGQETKLPGRLLPSTAQPTAEAIEPGWSLIPTAYAQGQQTQMAQKPFSPYDVTVGLESPDAIVRRKTRYELSLQDQSVAVPWIDGVLQDRYSSYRLRLGVLVALNNMPNLPAQALLPATITAIQNTLNDPDDALRNEALSLARKYQLIPVIVYEHFGFSGKWQAYGPGVFRNDKGQLGSLPNDSASSLRVTKGFSVRLCDGEGVGKGTLPCETKGAGSHQLRWGAPGSVADKVSFIQVYSLAPAAR